MQKSIVPKGIKYSEFAYIHEKGAIMNMLAKHDINATGIKSMHSRTEL